MHDRDNEFAGEFEVDNVPGCRPTIMATAAMTGRRLFGPVGVFLFLVAMAVFCAMGVCRLVC